MFIDLPPGRPHRVDDVLELARFRTVLGVFAGTTLQCFPRLELLSRVHVRVAGRLVLLHVLGLLDIQEITMMSMSVLNW